MTATRIFAYAITFSSGATVTTAAANKATACRNAVDFHGGKQWVQIVKIARCMSDGDYHAAALPRRTRHFTSDGKAPL